MLSHPEKKVFIRGSSAVSQSLIFASKLKCHINLCVDAVLHLCNYVGDFRTHDLLLISIISALQLRRVGILTRFDQNTFVFHCTGF